MQGLSDVLADVGEGKGETPAEEYAMMLEVTMADHPGQPHPPAFSWNAGMVMHILKSDPVLGSWNTCKWMARALPICSFMTSRAAGA